jgi:type I restriction enzyme S subunit
MSPGFWGRNVTLSDYVELNPRVTLLRGANVPFVSMDIISPGTRKVYPVQERPASGSGSKFGPGDTLFARITPCLENGKIAQYAGDRAGMGSTEFFVLRARDDISDPAFVYYFSQNPDLRSSAEKSMSGASGRQRAVISSLSEFECEFPKLAIQIYIAGILSAYDELIENSQRRIKILEAMARGLYREWFVHFRFPGHENHPRVASALGEIPQGWMVKKLSEIAILNYGKALKKEDRFDGDFPVFGSSGVIGTHNLALVKGPGIIVGRKGNVGSVFWCDDDFFVIDTAYFVTSSLPLRYLFYVLPTLNFINSDAAVPGLSRNQAYSLDVLVPPQEVLVQFCELANTFECQALTLNRQIQNLRRTRDLLLPRLLSGQIDVTKLDNLEETLS